LCLVMTGYWRLKGRGNLRLIEHLENGIMIFRKALKSNMASNRRIFRIRRIILTLPAQTQTMCVCPHLNSHTHIPLQTQTLRVSMFLQ